MYSSLGKIYSNFFEIDNSSNKYKSISEAYWSYPCLVFEFLDSSPNQIYQEKYALLRYFYFKD
uniref:Uncharacterized protein n=1 Tax=Osmundaria fimbriata TaxID=228265 RepID=A0A1Z1M569_OSMFI|nr:hypothetical protein [Osmundaria fimbriata]ARW60914.1 hypothetical protein [Osmundaria fimbriata]